MRVPSVLHNACCALAVAAIAATLAGAPRPAAAEDWPTRPVTLVLAFAPGSMIDFVGRALANDLSAAIGQPVLVESKAGGGVVASTYVAKAAPDGYTLLMTAVGPAVLRPLMDKSVGYDADADFTPIIMVGEAPNVLVANPKLGVETVKDLVASAKRNGGKISLGHSGPGTMGHLCSVLFAAEAGLDASSIAYRGTGPMMIDVLGGQIDAGFPAYNPATKAAKILAVTSDQRVDFLPGVPTMKESGFDVVGGTWEAIYGPAHLPAAIVAKLNAAMDAFLRRPETRRALGDTGFVVFGGAPAQVTERMAQDRVKWSPIIARRVASHGYYCLVANLFHREGKIRYERRNAEGKMVSFDTLPVGLQEEMRSHSSKVDRPRTRIDIAAMLEFCRNEPVDPGPAGSVGFCLGGRAAFYAAQEFPERFRANASLHGTWLVTDAADSPHRMADRMRGEFYCGFGARDRFATPATVAAIDQALSGRAGLTYRYNLYPGVNHGYALPDRDIYDQAAVETDWREIFAMFERQLAPSARGGSVA